VALCARRGDRLDSIRADLESQHSPQQFLALPLDVRRYADIERAVARCLQSFGRLDVLVTSAGIGVLDFLDRLDPANGIAAQIETNLTGAILLARAVLPHMIRRRSGSIVLVGSLAGLIAMPSYSIYAATKFGLMGFADGLRREAGVWGVRVSLLLPGAVATDFAAPSIARRRSRWRTPRALLLSTASVGEAVADLAERPRAMRIIPGWMAPILWLGRAAPWLVDLVADRFFVRRERAAELASAAEVRQPDERP